MPEDSTSRPPAAGLVSLYDDLAFHQSAFHHFFRHCQFGYNQRVQQGLVRRRISTPVPTNRA